MIEIWTLQGRHWSWYALGFDNWHDVVTQLGQMEWHFDEIRAITSKDQRPDRLY